MPFKPGESGNPDKQFKPGQSGNPAGKPKGAKHLRTMIQDMLADEEFEQKLKDGTVLKGAPLKAITKVAVAKAMSGDKDSREWLAKYGIGTKIDMSTGDEKLEQVIIYSPEKLPDEETPPEQTNMEQNQNVDIPTQPEISNNVPQAYGEGNYPGSVPNA